MYARLHGSQNHLYKETVNNILQIKWPFGRKLEMFLCKKSSASITSTYKDWYLPCSCFQIWNSMLTLRLELVDVTRFSQQLRRASEVLVRTDSNLARRA